jgi:hypothetical protein
MATKYRIPPIRRTRDSFIDDTNSVESPRIDLGEARHREVRRDMDTVKSYGITLHDIDHAIMSYIINVMKLSVPSSDGEKIEVPVVYANREKWVAIQKDGHLKDDNGKSLAPILAFRRTNVNIVPDMKKNKVASVNQIAYISAPRYNSKQPYDRFSLLSGGIRQQREYYATPIPDYVDISYDFIGWCDFAVEANSIIEQFTWHSGKSFGDVNGPKFATQMDSISVEDTNQSGEDKTTRISFQLMVHGYLLPKEISGEVTTKRIVAPTKIHFTSEAFVDPNTGIRQQYRSINADLSKNAFDVSERVGSSIDKSPDVYPSEKDNT